MPSTTPAHQANDSTAEARAQRCRLWAAMAEVWPGYSGPPADTIDVEIFEHWLEPA